MTKAMRKAASEVIAKRAKTRAADLVPTIAELQASGASHYVPLRRASMSVASLQRAGRGLGLRRRLCACWHGANQLPPLFGARLREFDGPTRRNRARWKKSSPMSGRSKAGHRNSTSHFSALMWLLSTSTSTRIGITSLACHFK
jgi:hypothetical protein